MDPVRASIAFAIPAMNFVLLAAVGLDLSREDFTRVRGQGPVVATGLIAPVILLPPLALALVGLFQPAPDVAASLLLIAACPIGGISNTYSYLAQASTALSVTLTAVSCLAAIVTIPVIGGGFELALGERLGLSAPISLLDWPVAPPAGTTGLSWHVGAATGAGGGRAL